MFVKTYITEYTEEEKKTKLTFIRPSKLIISLQPLDFSRLMKNMTRQTK